MKQIFRLSLLAAVVGVAMLATFAAAAQDTNSPPGTNETDEREVLASNVVDHVMAVAETNVVAASNDLALIEDTLSETNNPAPTNAASLDHPELPRDYSRNGDSRSNRRKSSRDSYSSRSPRTEDGANSSSAGSASTAGGRPDFSAFRIIAERNIFDPNRRGSRAQGTREKPRTVEAFSLVGIMSYEKGTFAFFDGSSSSYRKALKQNDSIAGYTVQRIDDSQVTLTEGTNRVDLKVGTQLRREDGGPWNLSRQAETLASTSSSSNPSATTTTTISNPTAGSTGGGESDVLRRLRERREKE